jgi:hypothetical protein
MRDPTRKAMTFHDTRATGITWWAVRGDDPLRSSSACLRVSSLARSLAPRRAAPRTQQDGCRSGEIEVISPGGQCA